LPVPRASENASLPHGAKPVSADQTTSATARAYRGTEGQPRGSAGSSDQPGTTRPLVLGAEDRNRHLGRVRIRRDAMIEEVLRGLLDFDVPGKRGDDWLVCTFGSHLLDHLDHGLGEHHRWGDDRVPVAQYQRMDARFLEP